MTSGQQTDLITYGNFIGGEWKVSSDTFIVEHKYTREPLARVSKASREDVHQAVEEAWKAFRTQPLSPAKRYDILMRAVQLFKEKKEELAITICREVGKTLKDARVEVERGIQTFIASAEEGKRIVGEGVPIQGQPGNENRLAFTVRVPVGVVGAITPFNFPFNLTAHKVAPALAAGNTVVLKPAELTPLSAIRMAEILQEAGLPAGYLNVVNGYGPETGQYLLENERISMFTFTGSAAVGRHVKSTTGIRKVTLELGNNSPNIVHHDAPDLKKAAELCVTRGMLNSGQACISVQRVYVHRSIYKQFLDEAVQVIKDLTYGDPESEETDVGCMISEQAAKRVESWIQEAVEQGACIVYGGKREGTVLQPTILKDVSPEMKVVCEEVFAPVICVIPYDQIEEAFEAANDSRYGLQAGVFTSDLKIAMRAVKELEFGGVIINDVSTFRADIMPYGGIKDSGVGKEGPKYAIHEMTDEKIVVINL